MVSLIFHQVFWTVISFLLFFICMKKFVIDNIVKIEQKRAQYMEKMSQQINSITEKSIILKNVAHKIIHEEIPEKKKLYIQKNLEPILTELELDELNEKQILQAKLDERKETQFKETMLHDKELHSELEAAAQAVVLSIQHIGNK